MPDAATVFTLLTALTECKLPAVSSFDGVLTVAPLFNAVLIADCRWVSEPLRETEIPDPVPARDKFSSPSAAAIGFALAVPERRDGTTEAGEAVAELLPAVFGEKSPPAAKSSSGAVASLPEFFKSSLSEASNDCQLDRKLAAAGTEEFDALTLDAAPCAVPVAFDANRLGPGSECPPGPISMSAATVMVENKADAVPKDAEEG
jgi:hypothetical protein